MTKKKSIEMQNKIPQLISEKTSFGYVEAYKTLRTNFNFLTANGKNRTILVTSALQDEGKSGLAINLAISLVQAGNKVLLVDADMRNPSLHRYLQLKISSGIGLSTLLTGEVKVGDCLVTTEQGMDVIAGGLIPPNPTELIGSEAMRELLQVAAQRYDYVICDAPPVGVITDAAALSPLCDGVLFAIRQRFASRNQVHSALRSLQSVNAKILGTVMTRYSAQKNGKGYGYGRYSRYSRYGRKYGYGYGYGYGYRTDK